MVLFDALDQHDNCGVLERYSLMNCRQPDWQPMTSIQQQEQRVMDSLNKSVHEALDRKRRLGQYAVVWKDGKIVRLFDNEDPTQKE